MARPRSVQEHDYPAEPEVRLEGRSAVFVGSFNPAILHPAWFSQKELLREAETRTADVMIVHPDVAIFKAGWVSLQASRETFEVSTSDAGSYDALRDLVVGVFRLLPETPVTALGLNHNFHYAMPTRAALDRIGDVLAPTPPWAFLENPSVSRQTMRGDRTDGRAGGVNVTTEPSILVHDGLYIAVNDHYDLTSDPPGPAGDALEIVIDAWTPSRERAEVAAEAIISLHAE